VSDRLTHENEMLHALLADASATLEMYAQTGGIAGAAAQRCLDRIRDGEPLDPYADLACAQTRAELVACRA